ncbi:MAG: hypothetical protein RTU30_07100 [Candidatus Thorarchaeota archaeon]
MAFAMGCEVNISYPASILNRNRILLVALLHVTRAIVFIAISFTPADVLFIFAWVGLLELLLARWFWSVRMESWGLVMGISLVHILFPATIDISILAFITITTISLLEIVLLGVIRREGAFSYIAMALTEPDQPIEVAPVERTMFNLTILAQVTKVAFVFLGILELSTILNITDPIPWIPFLPLIPFALFLCVIDIVAIIGFIQGRDWAFHLLVIMSCIGFVETVVAWAPMVILIAIWVVMLLMPCWVKNEFYRRVRIRQGLP